MEPGGHCMDRTQANADGSGLQSTAFGRNSHDLANEFSNRLAAVGEAHAFRRRRPLGQQQSRPPLLRWSNRPWGEAATAIGADIAQMPLDAIGAEGAFVAADARFGGGRQQVLVAIFAIRPKFERHVFAAKKRRT